MSDFTPRLHSPQRTQGELRWESLDQLLPPEHPVRHVWAFVTALDLAPLLQAIRSRPGSAGAPAIDPRLLMTLWLQATRDGVGSSRRLAALCEQHLVTNGSAAASPSTTTPAPTSAPATATCSTASSPIRSRSCGTKS